MNIVELYKKTPVERHKDIKVVGERVLFRAPDGSIDEYVIDNSGDLWLAHPKEERQDILAIRNKLGITETPK